ncbi:MAG: hypothetical protein IJB24_01345 [Clostridia bacterium]|nr:hypothetical protein [Clostridia bacterium]
MKNSLPFIRKIGVLVITILMCVSLVACGGSTVSLSSSQQECVDKHDKFINSLNTDNLYDEFTDAEFKTELKEINGTIIYIVKVIYGSTFHSTTENDFVSSLSDLLYSTMNFELNKYDIEAVILFGPSENDIQYRMGENEILSLLDQDGYFD